MKNKVKIPESMQMAFTNKKEIYIPNWLQVVLYILMIVIDGIYLGILINTAFEVINVNLVLLIFLYIFCMYGTCFVLAFPYVKECKRMLYELENGWIDTYSEYYQK